MNWLTATEGEVAATVAEDYRLGLVTVACPKCGTTAGILPASIAWHAKCSGVRMLPVDPEAAAAARARAKATARKRRWRLRTSGAHQKRRHSGAKTGQTEGSAGAPRPPAYAGAVLGATLP